MIISLKTEEELFSMTQNKFFAFLESLPDKIKGKDLNAIETLIETEGREILRSLLEECIKTQGIGDVGNFVQGSDNIFRSHRRIRSIVIKTLFGDVIVDKVVYSKPGHNALAPKEAMLNLPSKSYSYAIAKRVSREAIKGSFQEAIKSIQEYTGVVIPKRQAEEIVIQSAVNFKDFYSLEKKKRYEKSDELLILSTDGKGIVVRKEDLREQTKQRLKRNEKLKKRLAKGEKKNAKRMAQVASVYTIARYPRTPQDILDNNTNKSSPKPQEKRVWASIEERQDIIIKDMFDEAIKRDPNLFKEWVILIDGQVQQLKQIKKEINKRKIKASIIIDIIHVLEYLWKASYDFYKEGSKESEEWVNNYLIMILKGKASRVAAAIKRSATCRKLEKKNNVITCANYLCKYAPYLKYQEYLQKGWPIATGVIEGACRHLIKDRMDITGARWSLSGAEAILRLKSIYSSGDWEEYWKYHKAQEFERNHRSLYADEQFFI